MRQHVIRGDFIREHFGLCGFGSLIHYSTTGEFARARSITYARPVQCLVFVCSISSSVINNSFQASGQVGICVSLGIYFPANLLIFQYLFMMHFILVGAGMLGRLPLLKF